MDFNTQFRRTDNINIVELATKKDIMELKENLETNNRLMQRILEEIKLVQTNQIQIASSQTRILPKTPFQKKDSILNYESKIQESEDNFIDLVKELKERVSGHSAKFITNCWRLLMKDVVAKEFCWQGSKEKTEIKSFSIMLAIKFAYLQKFADHSETEFEKTNILYFQQAKNRFVKKSKP